MRDTVKDKDRFSILTSCLDSCYLCGSTDRVALHEVWFGSSNRAKSKKYGLVLPLCGPHHNLSNAGVHFNKDLDNRLKKMAEVKWIKEYTDGEEPLETRVKEFINCFGKNILNDDDLENYFK